MRLFEPEPDPSPNALRLFALGASAIGLWLVWATCDGWPAWAPALGLLAALGLLWPASARPPYRLLLLLTGPIRWLTSTLLLAAVYFGLITPIALLHRLGGRDVFGSADSDVPSYWIQRPAAVEDASPIAPFFRRY